MATHSLQPSEYEIQREVEALRDIRRRSTTPGALTIDPDLPNQTSPTSPTYRLGTSSSPASPSSETDSSSEGSSHSNTTNVTNLASTDVTTDDPFHLFWVPAGLHPEIAPTEFRAFLKQHARSPPHSDDEASSLSPASSVSSSSSSGLGRRRSMLSRQYRPAEHENDEDERVLPFKRNRSVRNRGPQLTISDLQKLEELAEKASQGDDPSKLRNILRRSLSLNLSPSAIERMDQMPELGDEADSPIIVPPPGQILRRAARTKIRKPSLQGGGGEQGFNVPRRIPTRAQTVLVEPRTSSDRSSSDHGDSTDALANHRRRTLSEVANQHRDLSGQGYQLSDDCLRDEDQSSLPASLPAIDVSESSQAQVEPELPPELPVPTISQSLFEALGPVIGPSDPDHLTTPEISTEQTVPSRTPSPPIEPPHPVADHPVSPETPPALLSSPPSQLPRKDKDRKGLFGKWGGDRGSKKGPKEKDRENRERPPDKEKDSGFFGSLFSGVSRRKQDEVAPYGSALGREMVSGTSKSKSFLSPMSPSLSAGIGPSTYARYPIHVERAIYRLSHIKLANPRRPLYEQVLISNLMFWYLGVINKAQSSNVSTNGQAVGAQAGVAGNTEQDDMEKVEKEQRDKEKTEKERQEKEQREAENKKRESGKRGSLTKNAAYGSPGGGRRAEIPVKGPQYEMQHRVMEQEYGGYNLQPASQMARSNSSNAGSGSGQDSRMSQSQPVSANMSLSQGRPQAGGNLVYYSTDQSQRLPPGATPEQLSWQQSEQQSTASALDPHSQKESQKLPNAGRYNSLNTSQDNLILGSGSERLPGRSLSMNAMPAAPPPQMNGRARKGQSAHVVISSPRRRPKNGGEQDIIGTPEEDMPLAMWQQQRRR